MDKLRQAADRIPLFDQLEKTYKIKKEYSMLLLCTILLFLILSTSLGPILCNIFSIIIPLQESLSLLKQVNLKREEVKHLLSFWILYALFSLLDSYSRFLTKLVPFFYALKLVFMLWVGPLRFKGGIWVYDNILVMIPQDWYVCGCGIDKAVKKASEVIREGYKSSIGEVKSNIGEVNMEDTTVSGDGGYDKSSVEEDIGGEKTEEEKTGGDFDDWKTQ